MDHVTHHSAQTALAASTRRHGAAGHSAPATMHPERAAVASHLHHMHSQITSPGMADHPLTPSEGHMLRTGAEQLNRAANTVA